MMLSNEPEKTSLLALPILLLSVNPKRKQNSQSQCLQEHKGQSACPDPHRAISLQAARQPGRGRGTTLAMCTENPRGGRCVLKTKGLSMEEQKSGCPTKRWYLHRYWLGMCPSSPHGLCKAGSP